MPLELPVTSAIFSLAITPAKSFRLLQNGKTGPFARLQLQWQYRYEKITGLYILS
jgi:hypothetical protein